MTLLDAIGMLDREESVTCGPRGEALRLVVQAASLWHRHIVAKDIVQRDDVKDDHE